ncbi:MAG TPA: type VI secretion system tip protein TssI/VgrG, partial [Polyangiaceae bacterium]|nr:type VI secretion system tip protein TssI/VgrG [Polyangiaceae bacterium]
MIFTLTSSAIPPMAKVAGFRGSERLSQPYVFDVYFTIENIPGIPLNFDLADAVYSKATLTIALGSNAPWSYSGILAAVRLVRAADNASLFHATLVPQVWQLTLTKHSRIWTKKSCIEVIGEVLDEAGVDHEFRLEQAYAQEEQITQYKESNLAFIQRWMDREGMYYFFEQGDSGDTLVITDNKASHGTLRTSPVKYWPQSDYADISAKQAFDNFAATHNALPASVKLIDYDYARPLLDVSSTVSVEANAVGEIAEYGGRFFTPQDAQRLATVRAEEQLKNKTTFKSTGAATSLAAGFKYTLEDHPLAQYNGDYLITEIEHYGYDAQFGPAWGALVEHKYNDVYRVELGSIGADTQYRNGLVTPWPRIDGYENAIVDGPAQSIYAQIDDQGRYNVKFKFDEGTNNSGKASTFVRMAQPHGGSQEGFHFPLRKNTEVICSFLGGDPDRPVITGVVHNMLNQSVVTQTNHTQNVIRSGSLNHLVMEDTAGSMWVEAYCPIFESTLFLGHGEWNFNLTTMGNGQIHTEINLQFDVNNEWRVDVVNNTTWFFHNELLWVVDN